MRPLIDRSVQGRTLSDRRGEVRPSSDRRVLAVVARRPERDHVKSRLAAAIGPGPALGAYRDLLDGTLRACEQVAGAALVLALDSPEPHHGGEAEKAWSPGSRWRVEAQRGAGLGARLASVFADAFGAGAASVVIVNSDSPALPPAYLRLAFDLLASDDSPRAGAPVEPVAPAMGGRSGGAAATLVAGPTTDGGYYLIGTDLASWRARGEEITAILESTPMGTASAFAHTEQAALERGLRLRSLPLWVDVDEPADLPVYERLTRGAAAPRGEPLIGLREVYLHVTNRCGLSCPQCYNSTAPRAPGELTTRSWKDAIDQCVALGARSFVFIGGDPFVRDDLLELIGYVTGARRRQARIFFNGLLDERSAHTLAQAGHSRLRPLVSVDGPEEVNDALRAPGNFANVLVSIRHLIAAGLSPVANTVVLRPTLAGLPRLARTLRAAGVERLHLIFPHQRGGLPEHLDLVPSGGEMLAAVRRLRRTAAEIGLSIDNVTAWQRRLRSRNDLCAAGCTDIAIDPYGKVHACPITCGDPAFVAGDLCRQELAVILRDSPGLRLLRHAHARDRAACAACPVVDACGGECWMQAHYAARVRREPAGPSAPFPYCDLMRPLFEELIAEARAEGGETPAGAETPVGVGAPDYTLFDCI